MPQRPVLLAHGGELRLALQRQGFLLLDRHEQVVTLLLSVRQHHIDLHLHIKGLPHHLFQLCVVDFQHQMVLSHLLHVQLREVCGPRDLLVLLLETLNLNLAHLQLGLELVHPRTLR